MKPFSQIGLSGDWEEVPESWYEDNIPDVNVLIPDKQAYNHNYDFIATGIRSGITFTALNFQYNDEQIKNYNKIFNSAMIGTNSFLLKKNKNNNIYYSPSIQAFHKKKIEEITSILGTSDIDLYNSIYK